MPRDLWRFLSADTAVVLSLGADAAAVAHTWDDDLADQVATSSTFNAALAPGHTYGAFSMQALVGAGLYAGGWFAKKERLARTGADIMRAQVLSQLYVQAIKYTAQRERPDASNNQSFPSGHSASAFATAGVLHRQYGWKVGVPAIAVAAYVATARVHDNHHYLSDVIFGGAMGIAAARTVTLHANRYRVTVRPAARKGSAAVVAAVDW
jgi:membrane-associated phospholipid phosphatase